MSFTPSQLEAITCRDASVLVSAGAGSGGEQDQDAGKELFHARFPFSFHSASLR